MTNPLSTFDQGIRDSFTDGALVEMPDTITIKGVTINCVVTERVNSKKGIQGGTSVEVSASVNVLKDDFKQTGANLYGGDSVTFSDGEVGKISAINDCAGPVYTLQIGPVLQGAAGPNGGQW